MKKIFALSILISFFSCSVKKASSTDNDKIIQKYTNSITAESLKKHLTIVAADDMEGRDTGSKGQKKAGLYLITTTAIPFIILPGIKQHSSFYKLIFTLNILT